MKLYRYAENPYKRTALNTHCNNIETNGTLGVFCFDPTRMAERYFDEQMFEEKVDVEFLVQQFGETAFGGQLNIIDVDENEIISRGYGRYANLHSDNWDDYIYIPECYVVFSEF